MTQCRRWIEQDRYGNQIYLTEERGNISPSR